MMAARSCDKVGDVIDCTGLTHEDQRRTLGHREAQRMECATRFIHWGGLKWDKSVE
jgi:hypothetical protein